MTSILKPVQSILGSGKFPVRSIVWFAGDRVFRMAASLATGIAVARYLGPGGSGILQSGIALATLLSAVVELGLDSLLRRDLVRSPEQSALLLGSAGLLRILAAIPSGILYVAIMRRDPSNTLALICWLSVLPILPVFLTIESWFLAHGWAKQNVLAQNTALGISALLRVGLILSHASIEAFAAAAAIEVVLCGICLGAVFLSHRGYLGRLHFSVSLSRRLLRDSFPILLTNLAAAVNRRVDLLILAFLIAQRTAGIYAAAVRIAELGYIFPMILSNAYFPLLARLHSDDQSAYLREMRRFFLLATWSCIGFALITTITGRWLVPIIYGQAFSEAIAPTTIYAWGSILVAQNIVRSQWLLLENHQNLGLFFALGSAALNVILNLGLVPRFGVSGAAISYVLSQAISQYILPLFFRATRPVCKAALEAFVPKMTPRDSTFAP